MLTTMLMDLDKISNLYRGPSIDASYHVSVHLDEEFQRRRLKCEKLTDDRWRMPSDGKSSHCLWQGGLKSKQWHLNATYFVFNINQCSNCFVILNFLQRSRSATNTPVLNAHSKGSIFISLMCLLLKSI